MSLNQQALATADMIFNGPQADSAQASYERARDFATACWRRALRQRMQSGARQVG